MAEADFHQAAITTAQQYGIPPEIFTALVAKESSWNPNAIGGVGEVGLTQLRPTTAAQLGVNPYDPLQNLKGGAMYLSEQFQRFGNWNDALAAYNAGPGNIQAGQGYAQSVLSTAQQSGLASGENAVVSITGTQTDPEGSWFYRNVLGPDEQGIVDFFSNITSAEWWSSMFFNILAIVFVIGLILFGLFAFTRSIPTSKGN